METQTWLTVLDVLVGLSVLAIATYFGITRDETGRRVQRLNYLFAMLFIFFALWIGTVVVALIASKALNVTPENFESQRLILKVIVNLLVGIPGVTALLRIVSMRVRDTGHRRFVAYLGATPLLQFLVWIWLLFPAPTKVEVAE